MTTQIEISHAEPLPRCKHNHIARHMHDRRGVDRGGGHFIECRCGQTKKHPAFEPALLEWRRMHRIRAARVKVAPPAQPDPDNVLQLHLRLPA